MSWTILVRVGCVTWNSSAVRRLKLSVLASVTDLELARGKVLRDARFAEPGRPARQIREDSRQLARPLQEGRMAGIHRHHPLARHRRLDRAL